MTIKLHALWLCVALIVLSVVHCANAGDFIGPYETTVLRVVDGDTFVARIRTWPGKTRETGDYKVIKVRLAGANTPELHSGPDCERKLGAEALSALSRLLKDPVQTWIVDIDKYADRIDARVVANGIDVAEELIRLGVARSYDGGARGEWCNGG